MSNTLKSHKSKAHDVMTCEQQYKNINSRERGPRVPREYMALCRAREEATRPLPPRLSTADEPSRIKDDLSPLIRVLKKEDECPATYLSILGQKPLHHWGHSYYFEIEGAPGKWLCQPFGAVELAQTDTYINMRRLNTLNQMCKADAYGIGPKVYEAYVCGDVCFAVIQSWSLRTQRTVDCGSEDKGWFGKIPDGDPCSIVTTRDLAHLLDTCMANKLSVDGHIGFVENDRPVFVLFDGSVSLTVDNPDSRLIICSRVYGTGTHSGIMYKLMDDHNNPTTIKAFTEKYIQPMGFKMDDILDFNKGMLGAGKTHYSHIVTGRLIETVSITPLSLPAVMDSVTFAPKNFEYAQVYVDKHLIPNLGDWTNYSSTFRTYSLRTKSIDRQMANQTLQADSEFMSNPLTRLLREKLEPEEFTRILSDMHDRVTYHDRERRMYEGPQMYTFRNGHQSIREVQEPLTYMIHDNGGRPFQVVLTMEPYAFERSKLTVNIHGRTGEDFPEYTRRPIHSIKAEEVFVGRDPTERKFSYETEGNTLLVRSDLYRGYTWIGNHGILSFDPFDRILLYMSFMGNSDVPYPWAIDAQSRFYCFLSGTEKNGFMSFLIPGVRLTSDFDTTIDPYELCYRLPHWVSREQVKSLDGESHLVLKGATREEDVDEYTRRTRYGQVCVYEDRKLTLNAYLLFVETMQPKLVPFKTIYPREYVRSEEYKQKISQFDARELKLANV